MTCAGDSGSAADLSGEGEPGGPSSSAAVGSVVSQGGGEGKWARRTLPPLFCDVVFSEDEFEFERDQPVGMTSFRRVFFGVQKKTGLEVALWFTDVGVRAATKQFMLLVKCAHPLIVPVVGLGVSPSPFLVTKFMRNRDLEVVLAQEFASKPPAGWDATAKSKCVFGIAAGMAFLHSKKIIHRDLRPRSVLLDDDFEPVISNFDSATVVDTELESDGCVLFIAPEIFLGEAYDEKADVYAFAVLLWHMFDDHVILGYKSPFRFARLVTSGKRLPLGKKVPGFYRDLICLCWHQDPKARPSFVEIVEHLRSHTSEYALDGSDLARVCAYENQVLESISDVLAADN